MALQDSVNYAINKQRRQKELEKEEKQRQKNAELLKKELIENLKSDIKAMLVFQFEKEKNIFKNYEFIENNKLKYAIYDKILKRYSVQSYKLDFNIGRYLDNIYEKTFKEFFQKEKLIKKLKEEDEEQQYQTKNIEPFLAPLELQNLSSFGAKKEKKHILKNIFIGVFGTIFIILHEISKMGDD